MLWIIVNYIRNKINKFSQIGRLYFQYDRPGASPKRNHDGECTAAPSELGSHTDLGQTVIKL